MLTEIIEEPEQMVEEGVEDEGEICDDDLNEILHDAFRSIIPPHMFDYFTGFFSNQSYGSKQHEEVKKEAVEEIIDVFTEMTAENLTDIADKAMMAKLNVVEKKSET
ncbi:hypothetical protein Hanom_Chr13g01195951 [Helianthus anomalus]